MRTSLGSVGSDYTAVLAGCGSAVEALFLSNVTAGEVRVDLRVSRAAGSAQVLAGAAVPAGSSLVPFLSKDSCLNLEPGDLLEARCSVDGGCDFVCSYADGGLCSSSSSSGGFIIGDCACYRWNCETSDCDIVLVGCPEPSDPCYDANNCCSYVGLLDQCAYDGSCPPPSSSSSVPPSSSSSSSSSGCACSLGWSPSECVDAYVAACYVDDGKLPSGPLPSFASVKVPKEIYVNNQLYLYDPAQNKWISDNDDSLSISSGRYLFTHDGETHLVRPALRYRRLYNDYALYEDGASCKINLSVFAFSPDCCVIIGGRPLRMDGSTPYQGVFDGNVRNDINANLSYGQLLSALPCMQSGGETWGGLSHTSYVRNGSDLTILKTELQILDPIEYDYSPPYPVIGNIIQYWETGTYDCDGPSPSYTRQSFAYAYDLWDGSPSEWDESQGCFYNLTVRGTPQFTGQGTLFPGYPNFNPDVSFGSCPPLSITYGSTCRSPSPSSNCTACTNSPSVDYTTLPSHPGCTSGCAGRPIDIDVDACDATVRPTSFSKGSFVLYYQGGPGKPFLVVDDVAYDPRGAGLIKVLAASSPEEMRAMVCARVRFATLVDEAKLTTDVGAALASDWPYNDLYWFSACGNLPGEVPINLVPC